MAITPSGRETILSAQEVPARLRWREGEQSIEFLLTAREAAIGRDVTNDITLDDLELSRFHCKVMRTGAGHLLVDLGSTNGTYLNDELIVDSGRTLSDGDIIRIGQRRLVYEVLKPEPPQPAEPERLPREAMTTMVVPDLPNLPRLVVTAGVNKDSQYPLTRDKMIIGRASRDKHWDIDLVDRSVSRPHAQIVRRADGWVVSDMGSANGTQVNGKDLTEAHLLRDGDTITFGELTLVFRAGQRD
jgi:pSer/pThr/pTyr-binding forkhead associated (FHA) protein